MATVNALCLDSLPSLLYQLLEFKQMYGRERVSFTLNILRFPSFQSPLVLPDNLRTHYKDRLQDFLDRNRNNIFMHEHELNHLQRLVDYLDVVKTPHSEAFELTKLNHDFRQFYMQYDQRRNKDFIKTFPNLKKWYESIQL
jgi:hypothetical protein